MKDITEQTQKNNQHEIDIDIINEDPIAKFAFELFKLEA
jgi:hypothetical protein